MLYSLHNKNKIKKNSGNNRLFQQKIILPFPSSHDLPSTQAAADLTHDLLHPQTVGPFCKVGDEQAIALKRLASSFASAKQRNKNNPLAPKDEIENNAPQRVQTTVSRLRVAATDQYQISLQLILPSQSTPISHRRPQTTHVMVRRSARQQTFIPRYDGRDHKPGKSLLLHFIPNQIHQTTKYQC
jgi:hypothetical protein